MNQTKKTLEGLKDLRFLISTVTEWVSPVIGAFRKNVSTAIGWGEVLEKSKKVLPDEIKRLIPTHPNFSLEIDNLQIAHNELINSIRPILAKAILENKEKDKRIEGLEKALLTRTGIISKEDLRSYQVMEQELQSAKDKIKELK